MGVFTEHMTRLCAEIVGMKRGRQALDKALAHEGRSRERTVHEMRAAFTSARQAMGRKTRQERMAFLTAIRRAVQAQRQAMQTDLAEARRAWEGKGA